MAKRKGSFFSFAPFMRKSSLTAVAALLAWVIYQLTEHAPFPQKPATLPASNAPVELYSNQTGDDLTQLYIQAIDQAKKSITLSIYALTDKQVIQALRRKSEEGIPVFIVSHAQASKGLTQKLPQTKVIRRVGEGLMHQKILIIDDKEMILGSANLTRSSLAIHGNLVIALNNPALAEALTRRIKSMDEDGGVSDPLRHQETQAGTQNVELWVLPDDPTAPERIIQLLRSAQKTIKVAMFAWTRTDFAQELIDAAKRGVKVEVVLDRYLGKGASAKIVRMLEEAKIAVRLSTGRGLLHHKFAYIDDRILVNGSANWTTSAFKVNDDYFLVVYPLTEEQREKMNRMWQVILQHSAKPDARINLKERT